MAKKQNKKIYYGNYKLYRSGTIVRIKPGNGTHVGRILTPYTPKGSSELFVKLYYAGFPKQFKVSELLKRHF